MGGVTAKPDIEQQHVDNQTEKKPISVKTASFEILKKLMADGHYLVNVKSRDKGLFWLDDSGLWVTWPHTFGAMEAEFKHISFSGYPRQPGVFLSALRAEGLVEEKNGECTWTANISAGGSPIKLTLAKILNDELVALARKMSQSTEVKIKPNGYDIDKELAEVSPRKKRPEGKMERKTTKL